MFAYCYNSPVNHGDDTGDIPFWVVVANGEGDWGLAHRLVQADIKRKFFAVETEVPVDRGHTRGGRVDIYQNGYIWEVKSIGRCAEAYPQALSYKGCKVSNQNRSVKDLGPANAFSGVIPITLGGYNYAIFYRTPSKGVVIYWIHEIQSVEQEKTAVTPEVSQPSPGYKLTPCPVPVVPIPFVPDASNGYGLPGNRDPWTLDAY